MSTTFMRILYALAGVCQALALTACGGEPKLIAEGQAVESPRVFKQFSHKQKDHKGKFTSTLKRRDGGAITREFDQVAVRMDREQALVISCGDDEVTVEMFVGASPESTDGIATEGTTIRDVNGREVGTVLMPSVAVTVHGCENISFKQIILSSEASFRRWDSSQIDGVVKTRTGVPALDGKKACGDQVIAFGPRSMLFYDAQFQARLGGTEASPPPTLGQVHGPFKRGDEVREVETYKLFVFCDKKPIAALSYQVTIWSWIGRRAQEGFVASRGLIDVSASGGLAPPSALCLTQLRTAEGRPPFDELKVHTRSYSHVIN